MIRVFFDANVFLDVFAKRVPFYQHSARVLTLVEQQQVTGYTSSLNFSNLFYIIRKQHSRDVALTYLRQLVSFINILSVDEQIITLALHSSFTDFEDAVQFYTAKHHQISFLITRNKKDYISAHKKELQIVTPEEFLLFWKATFL
ncbi:MAG: VapC toxin family PIN domain ribonuclease [Acidobacteria bacterium]|nr:MAG: VapC toxin family PIN domain ribonuclease [Acidobacteriota bacterium]